VAGSGGSAGGLYLRRYVRGLVLVNSSSGDLSYSLTSSMKQARWSGGGEIDSTGNPPSYSLDYGTDVPAGMLTVPASSVIVLRDPAGAPAPGDEGDAPADGGMSNDGGTTSDGGSGNADAGADGGSGGAGNRGGATDSTRILFGGCTTAASPSGGDLWLGALMLLAASSLWLRRRGTRK